MKVSKVQHERVERAINHGKQQPVVDVPWWRLCNHRTPKNWALILGLVSMYVITAVAYVSSFVFMIITQNGHPKFMWFMLWLVSSPFAIPFLVTCPGIAIEAMRDVIDRNRELIQEDLIDQQATDRREREEMIK